MKNFEKIFAHSNPDKKPDKKLVIGHGSVKVLNDCPHYGYYTIHNGDFRYCRENNTKPCTLEPGKVFTECSIYQIINLVNLQK